MECFLEPIFLYFWRSAGQFCVLLCVQCCHLPSTSPLCLSQCLLPLPECPSVLHPGQILPLYPCFFANWDPHEYQLPITGSHRETGTLDLTRLCALQRLAMIEKPWFCLLDFFTFLFEIKSIWSPLQNQFLVDITTPVFRPFLKKQINKQTCRKTSEYRGAIFAC